MQQNQALHLSMHQTKLYIDMVMQQKKVFFSSFISSEKKNICYDTHWKYLIEMLPIYTKIFVLFGP